MLTRGRRTMDDYVWTTTRRLTAGTREAFEGAGARLSSRRACCAYALYAEEGQDVVGVSIWDSRESCERYRASEIEARRRDAMAPFVLDERSSTYLGRELAIPAR
jgi:heme-degrading monooxygenase HmoA